MSDLYRINIALEGELLSAAARRRQRAVGLSDLLTDPLVLLVFAFVVIAFGYAGYSEFTTQSHYEELLDEVSIALRDSTQLDEDIHLANNLRKRQIEITEYMNILREIDRGRYTWAHLMDEFALAAPADLWLQSWREIGSTPADGRHIEFEIVGYSSSSEILSDFIRALEASPWIANVSFTNSQQKTVAEQNVTEFTIRAVTEDPDPSLLEIEKIGPDGRTAGPQQLETAVERSTNSVSAELPLLPQADALPSPAGPIR